MAGFLFVGCGPAEQSSAKPEKPATSSGNPLTAPVDYLGAINKAKKTADKTVQGVGITQAIQLFYAQEGRYPKSLNELVGPNYLSTLPQPPAGMKFAYNPQTGAFKIVPK